MKCKKCDSPLPEGARFCLRCGSKVSEEVQKVPTAQSAAPVQKASIPKKIFQVISVVLFILALSAVSSSSSANNVSEGLKSIYDVLNITLVITLIVLLTEWWKNRKSNKTWFGWRWITLLLVLSVVGLGGMIFSRALIVAREKVAAANDTWPVYNAPEGTFSVRFPSDPVHDTQSQNTTNGVVTTDTYKQADHTASFMYVVNVTELPSAVDVSNPNTILENSVNLSAKNGNIVNSDSATYDAYPSISYLIAFPSTATEVPRIRGINVLVGHRLYQLLTAYEEPQTNLLEFDKFADSFEIN